MFTILIHPKNQVTKGVKVKAFIGPHSSYNTLQLVGLSMSDLIALRDYQMIGQIANNACVIDLNKYNYDVLD